MSIVTVPSTQAIPRSVFEGAHLTANHFGFRGDNAYDNTGRLLAAISALRSMGGARLLFPPGDYLFDNSGGRIEIEDATGLLEFAPGARWLIKDNNQPGLFWRGGNNLYFRNFRIRPQTIPTERSFDSSTGDRMLNDFWRCSDMGIDGYKVEFSPTMGSTWLNCDNIRIKNYVAKHTYADGIHIRNCRSFGVDSALLVNTGDDGISVVDYGPIPGSPDFPPGRHGHDITISNAISIGSGSRNFSCISARRVLWSNVIGRTADKGNILIGPDGNLGDAGGQLPVPPLTECEVNGFHFESAGKRLIPIIVTAGSSVVNWLIWQPILTVAAMQTPDSPIRFWTEGTFPAGIIPDTDPYRKGYSVTYYARDVFHDSGGFRFAAVPGGPAVTVGSGGEGDMYVERLFPTATEQCGVFFESVDRPNFEAITDGSTLVTMGNGAGVPVVHGLSVGFSGTLRGPSVPDAFNQKNMLYVVATPTPTTVQLSFEPGGTPVAVPDSGSLTWFFIAATTKQIRATLRNGIIRDAIWAGIAAEHAEHKNILDLDISNVTIERAQGETTQGAGISVLAKTLRLSDVHLDDLKGVGAGIEAETLYVNGLHLKNVSQDPSWTGILANFDRCASMFVENMTVIDQNNSDPFVYVQRSGGGVVEPIRSQVSSGQLQVQSDAANPVQIRQEQWLNILPDTDVEINWANRARQVMIIDQAVNFLPAIHHEDGREYQLWIAQDSTGGWVPTWDTAYWKLPFSFVLDATGGTATLLRFQILNDVAILVEWQTGFTL